MQEEKPSGREARAAKAVSSLGVKLHVFNPSGRQVWTVVGQEGDVLVDLDEKGKRQPYCSCDDFHFRVLSGSVPECYHLIALRKARESRLYSKIEFQDDEYIELMRALLSDIFARIS